MKKAFKTFVFATAILLCGNVSFAQAPGCNSAAEIVSKMWQSWDKVSDKLPGDVPGGQFLSFAAKSITNWNQEVAGNSWATIGPRSLNFGEKANGNVLGQTTRVFILPPSNKETVTITIKKIDGKAKTGISVCSEGKKGNTRTDDNYTFNNSDKKETKIFTINNAKNRVLSVTIKNYSVGNKFQYTIEAN
jgi:hypothetical protein